MASIASPAFKLSRDFPDGLFGFIDAATKAYKKVDIFTAVESCSEKAWQATKQIFLNEPTLPLYKDVAVALEKSIQKLASA